MAILGAFSSARPAMGLQDISRRTGLAVSTTHRLVTELANWGALTRVDEYTYAIGPLIRRLAATSSTHISGEGATTGIAGPRL